MSGKKQGFIFLLMFAVVFSAAFLVAYRLSYPEKFDSPVTTEHITYDNSASISPPEDFENLLIYPLLSDGDKAAYNGIYAAVNSFEKDVIISSDYDIDGASRLLFGVLADHPEIYWIASDFTYASNGVLTFTYTHTEEECTYLTPKLEAAARELLSNVNVSADDYTVSLGILNLVVQSVTYDSDAGELEAPPHKLNTIEGALLDGRAICGGYVRLMQYLLNRAGLRAAYVAGDAVKDGVSEGHAWLLHEMDGSFYYSDPTWADSYENNEAADILINHTYFGMTLEDISADHTLSDYYEPFETESIDDNFYVREGLYFEEYSGDTVEEAVLQSVDRLRLENGGVEIELRFSSNAASNNAYYFLVQEERIYDIAKRIDGVDPSRIKFSDDERRNTMMIYINPVGNE